jgi:isopentenyldiphosphate isomerase
VLNDPSELLEVLTASGQPTGRAKPRGQVHRDGDWHRAVHCWLARRTPHGPDLLLQRRSAHKDTWPGYFDVSAAGHVRFGEEEGAAAREVEEELGISVPPDAPRRFGRHREETVHPNGVVDREHYVLHLLPVALPLEAFHPDPREVAALAWVPARALAELMAGARAELPAEYGEYRAGRAVVATVPLRREQIVPRGGSYYRRLAKAAERLVGGGAAGRARDPDVPPATRPRACSPPAARTATHPPADLTTHLLTALFMDYSPGPRSDERRSPPPVPRSTLR